jgi:hypothetical protein
MKSATIKPLKQLNPRSPDTKYMGDEPMWKVQPTDNRNSQVGKALYWYGYFYGKKEAKDFVATYLERHDRAHEAKRVRTLPDSQVRPTTGWLCRMVDQGLVLNEHEQIKLDNLIAELLANQSDKMPEPAIEAEPVVKPNIQDRLRDRASECMGELEGLFDDFITSGAKLTADFKPVSLMRSMNVAPQMIGMIRDRWNRKLDEFETVVAGRDADLVKGYDHMTKIQLKNCVKFCELVLDDCNSYVQIKKVERKPRKIKPVSPEKRAAKFKICAEFVELKLRSLPAASLVDKSEAWLYDTKKRKLIHLIADEYAKTFTLKNNGVIGFSAKDTVQKTLRKPAEQLKEITAGGKPSARKAFKEIRATETAWNGRGNEHLVILKCW